MTFRHPLRTAVFFFSLACLTVAARLEAQQGEDSRSAAAVRIIGQRLNVSSAELRAVHETKVGDVFRVKVLHLRSGRIEAVDLDGKHREVPRDKVEALLAARRAADFQGKLEKDLVAKLSGRAAAEPIEVLVWARTNEPPRIERDTGAEAAGPSESAVRAFQAHNVHATSGLRELARSAGWSVEYQAREAPVIVMSLPIGELKALEAREDVEAVYLARVYKPESDVSVPAVDAPTVHGRGITGSGVPVAVVEADAIYFDHDNLADGVYCNSLTESPIGSHASGVAGIVASTHATFRGAAPGVSLLSGNTRSSGDADIIACTEWAVANGARVINYSFGVDSASSLAGLDRYVDYVGRFRTLTMVKSSGNIGTTCSAPDFFVTSPGKGWNILTVGSYDDRGTAGNADDVMSDSSCFQDPASPYGDREKPEVAAPGTEITTTFCASPSSCTGTASGTSFAAPHVAGCAALLMQRNVLLRSWPESIRAILLASAVVNLEGSTRLSEKDGAGGIECDSADDIVRGAAGGELHSVLYASSSFPRTYFINANAGATVRVAIAWDSTPDSVLPPTTDILKADLDLIIRDPAGSTVAWSTSFDNSYEIVELTAPVTGTYTAWVSKYRWDGHIEYLGAAWWSGAREK